MYKEFTHETFKVGDKVSTCYWTDRNPGTIVEVRRNGREIVVQEDEAIAEGEDLPIGHQSWKIERNENGPKRVYTWRTSKGKSIGYIPKGSNVTYPYRNQVSMGWSYYYDWSF